jgi:alkylhydroperoxidase family enzyme
MAWIRTVASDAAVGHLERLYAEAVRRAGRVYGIVRAMSLNPVVLEASMGIYLAVMHGPSGLSRRRREMLAVVTSASNHCHY